jgi:hypothetical protein
METKFARFREACDYKIEDSKRFECGDCKLFVSEEEFINSKSDWGSCPYHSHAFLRFRRACYSFEKK